MNRRNFLFSLTGMASMLLDLSCSKPKKNNGKRVNPSNPKAFVYRALNGKPSENMRKAIEISGGIESVVGKDDIVVINPNIQWYNQGAPNLSAVKTLVDMVMQRTGGFSGEVVIAENNHYGTPKQQRSTAGWEKKFVRNSDIKGVHNYNQLCSSLKMEYGDQFSAVVWYDIDCGAKRVYSPEQVEGYVYCDGTGGVPELKMDNGASGKDKREVVMSYPVFKTGKGTVVDMKNGILNKGKYTDKRLRYINCAALNHHSTYCGATSAMKNILGVVELSGGADPYNGRKMESGHYNFHSFPFNKWSPGPVQGMLGAEIGIFLNTIRKPDLNITTAEWVGVSSRTNPPVVNTRAIAVSKDVVALDYHTFKYILYPNSHIDYHNPDEKDSPVRHDLKKCALESNSIFNEDEVSVESYDFHKGELQKGDAFSVSGRFIWGQNIKALIKYFLLRVGIL